MLLFDIALTIISKKYWLMLKIQQETLSPEIKKQIDTGFSQHAILQTGHDDRKEPVAFVAMDEGIFAGACVAAVFWGALHIKYVYVEQAYRLKGLGTKLMENAFTFGREQKCTFAFVETMSFQAADFYKKMGFELEFTREGFSHGTSFHYLRKKL